MTEGELYRNTFAETLRQYVGRGRHWRADDLAEATGLPARRIYAFLEAEFQPNLTDIQQLARELPGSFMRDVFAPAGVTGVTKRQEPMTNPRKMQSSICKAASDLAEHLEDNKFDHQERAQFLPVAERLREDLDAFIAGNVARFPIKGAAE